MGWTAFCAAGKPVGLGRGVILRDPMIHSKLLHPKCRRSYRLVTITPLPSDAELHETAFRQPQKAITILMLTCADDRRMEAPRQFRDNRALVRRHRGFGT
jgi:hypothetical protein